LERQREQKEDWMKKKLIFLATVAFVVMLFLAPMAMAQSMSPSAGTSASAPTPPTGGPAILLPAAALLLGSGILTYAILRRR
jgi:hypothetical protein